MYFKWEFPVLAFSVFARSTVYANQFQNFDAVAHRRLYFGGAVEIGPFWGVPLYIWKTCSPPPAIVVLWGFLRFFFYPIFHNLRPSSGVDEFKRTLTRYPVAWICGDREKLTGTSGTNFDVVDRRLWRFRVSINRELAGGCRFRKVLRRSKTLVDETIGY